MDIKNKLKVSVIGAGAGGTALSAVLSYQGFDVAWWSRNQEWLKNISGNGNHLEMTGLNKFVTAISFVSNDIREAVKDSKIIFVVVPAHAHIDIASKIAQHVSDNQIIILNPGRTAGAVEFRCQLRKHGCNTLPPVFETQSFLYVCRKKSDVQVELMAIKKHNVIASIPNRVNNPVIDMLGGIYHGLEYVSNTLETSLSNIGAILHPAPVLMNIGWIESRKNTFFPHYYYGISRSIAGFLEEMDEERLAVATAYGVNVRSVRDWHGDVYGVKGENLYDTLQMNAEYASLDAPYTLQHRYITEDVPTGLVPISELAKIVNVPTPKIDLVISMASNILKIDFRTNGRNLTKLGLDGAGIADVWSAF